MSTKTCSLKECIFGFLRTLILHPKDHFASQRPTTIFDGLARKGYLNTAFYHNSNEIKSFTILAVLRRRVERVCGAHLCVIAPGQHSCSFRRNVAAVASLTTPDMNPRPPVIKIK